MVPGGDAPWGFPGARIVVPDGTDIDAALARTTDLGVVAHPDDLELSLVGPVLACRNDNQRWFTGVVCTDGAGSVRPQHLAHLDDAEFVAVRADEQVAAAHAAGMSAVVLLGVGSQAVCDPRGDTRQQLITALKDLVAVCAPAVVHTHDPADLHDTHRGVMTAVVDALRGLPNGDRPAGLVGWEGWRSVDWVTPEFAVTCRVDDADLATELVRLHASQVATKRYDTASRGRRHAHATFADHLAVDGPAELAMGVDLSALLDDATNPADAVQVILDAFTRSVTDSLDRWWAKPAPGDATGDATGDAPGGASGDAPRSGTADVDASVPPGNG